MAFKNPFPTVDIIIENMAGIGLIERANPPFGWAIPGGFVDYGESWRCRPAGSTRGNGIKYRVVGSVPYIF